MMFNKVSLITSLLFFLLGTNVFAYNYWEVTSFKNGERLSELFQNNTDASVDNKEVITHKKTENQMEYAALLPNKVKADELSFKDYVVPGLVGLIIIFGFGSYWLIYRRKHS